MQEWENMWKIVAKALKDLKIGDIDSNAKYIVDMLVANATEKRLDGANFIAVASTDEDFLSRLVDFLMKAHTKPNSTQVRMNEMDPYEELDLRLGQIEGMTIRIHDLEQGK